MKLSTDNLVMLFSALAIGGGLVYLGRQLGALNAQAESVTSSPLARILGV